MNTTKAITLIALFLSGLLISCGGEGEANTNQEPAEPIEIYTPKPKASKFGVGPIQEEMELAEINPEMAKQGEAVFEQMCVACHKMDKRHVGPPLGEVVDRRNPAWIMNMILDPEKMVKEDPTAKQLLAEYLSPMANQNLTKEQARQVLEYFRKYNADNK